MAMAMAMAMLLLIAFPLLCVSQSSSLLKASAAVAACHKPPTTNHVSSTSMAGSCLLGLLSRNTRSGRVSLGTNRILDLHYESCRIQIVASSWKDESRLKTLTMMVVVANLLKHCPFGSTKWITLINKRLFIRLSISEQQHTPNSNSIHPASYQPEINSFPTTSAVQKMQTISKSPNNSSDSSNKEKEDSMNQLSKDEQPVSVPTQATTIAQKEQNRVGSERKMGNIGSTVVNGQPLETEEDSPPQYTARGANSQKMDGSNFDPKNSQQDNRLHIVHHHVFHHLYTPPGVQVKG